MTLELTIDAGGNIVTAGSAALDTPPGTSESVNVSDNGEVTIVSSDPLGTDTESFAALTSDGWTLLATNCTGGVSTLKNTLDDGAGNAHFQGAVSGDSLTGLAVTGRLFDMGGTVFNVLAYGADPTGSNPSDGAINEAITAAKQNNAGLENVNHGGGIVYIPPGRYLISNPIVLYSGITLQGAGSGATVLVPGSDFSEQTYPAIIITDNFTTLFRTDDPVDSGASFTFDPDYPGAIPWSSPPPTSETTAPPSIVTGPCNLCIQNLAIDGTLQMISANGQRITGLNLYGYDFVVENVEVRMMSGNGASIAWGGADMPGYPNGMEAWVRNCKFAYNYVHGLQFWGPHDSIISNCIFLCNNLDVSGDVHTSSGQSGCGLSIEAITTLAPTSTYSYEGSGANAVRVDNCHMYGPSQQAAMLVDLASGGLVKVSNCTMETGISGGLLVNGGNIQIAGCDFFPANSTTGIYLGATHLGYYSGEAVETAIINGVYFAPGFTYGIYAASLAEPSNANNTGGYVLASGIAVNTTYPFYWASSYGEYNIAQLITQTT
ncbi:MAG: glycosyl hydrolase family 28-related protein [Acidimicrobiales bacterium]